MKFCPKCGTIMVKKQYWECPKCGYKEKGDSNVVFVEKTENKKEITVVEDSPEVLPIDQATACPKCGHKGVYYWYMQTRASDEPETKFYRCPKCGYTWREYD